jgi:hypothetical protein
LCPLLAVSLVEVDFIFKILCLDQSLNFRYLWLNL